MKAWHGEMQIEGSHFQGAGRHAFVRVISDQRRDERIGREVIRDGQRARLERVAVVAMEWEAAVRMDDHEHGIGLLPETYILSRLSRRARSAKTACTLSASQAADPCKLLHRLPDFSHGKRDWLAVR